MRQEWFSVGEAMAKCAGEEVVQPAQGEVRILWREPWKFDVHRTDSLSEELYTPLMFMPVTP